MCGGGARLEARSNGEAMERAAVVRRARRRVILKAWR